MWRMLLFVVLAIPLGVILFVGSLNVWHYFNTRGMAYFGRSATARMRFKRQLARAGRLLRPLLQWVGPRMAKPNLFAFAHRDIYFPANSCNRKSVQQAIDYAPQAHDLFVVTQMKSGTTWMQQIAYEVLSRGEGDLGDARHNHLYALSPWLESFNGVALADAPLIGDAGRRLIKTHLPAQVCPYGPQAKYIYVARHPVSCFRSTVDFYRAVAGPYTPSQAALLDWFCSDDMWWGSWPDHVSGYWQWAATRPNVLFVHFEEMKADLPGVVRRVASFMGCTLDETAVAQVVDKSSFAYMKAHEEQFEMVPPSFFSVEDTFFRSGATHVEGGETIDAGTQARISDFCRTRLADQAYPVAQFYPDLQPTK